MYVILFEHKFNLIRLDFRLACCFPLLFVNYNLNGFTLLHNGEIDPRSRIKQHDSKNDNSNLACLVE